MALRTLGIALIALSATAPAQWPSDMVRGVEFKNIQLADALELILHRKRYSYIVHPFVDGRITLNIGKTRLSDVLQKIASQTGSIVVYRNGIFEFVLQREWPGGDSPDPPILPAVSFQKVPLKRALEALQRAYGISYNVDPEVDLHRLVTVARKGEHWEATWRDGLRQAHATYRSGGGILQVVLRDPPDPGGPRVDRIPPESISVTFHRTPFRWAVITLGKWLNQGEPPIRGTVSLVLENKSCEGILRAIRDQLSALNADDPFFQEFFAASRRPERGWPADTMRRKQ